MLLSQITIVLVSAHILDHLTGWHCCLLPGQVGHFRNIQNS